jgi:hypothetical protein
LTVGALQKGGIIPFGGWPPATSPTPRVRVAIIAPVDWGWEEGDGWCLKDGARGRASRRRA